LEHLGRGAFGTVDKVRDVMNGFIFARKTVKANLAAKDVQRSLRREIDAMKGLSNPHVVRFVTAYYYDSAVNIIMEPAADMTLKHYFAKPSKDDNTRTPFCWVKDLSAGLAYLHDTARIRHNDIKPENILLHQDGKTWKVLIADFGIAK
ncbi:kinase-like protein, partial [Aulographum hederae CBS 113979]